MAMNRHAAIEYLASLSEEHAQIVFEMASRRRSISVGRHVYIQDLDIDRHLFSQDFPYFPCKSWSLSWLHSIRICGEQVESDLACGDNDIRDAVVDLASVFDIHGLEVDKYLRPQRQRLSLLDVAVLVGDRRLAKQLFRFGVPQIFRFEYGDFSSFRSGLVTEECSKKIEAALWAGIDIAHLPTTMLSHWWRAATAYLTGLLDLDGLLARAIAGRQRKAAYLLRQCGAVAAFNCKEARALFRVAGGRSGELRFFLDPDCIHLAVDLGVELRSIKVDPAAACRFACSLHHRNYIHQSAISWDMTPTTLLAMAVLCGQDRVAELLAERSCDASSLQSEDVLLRCCPQLGDASFSILVNADATPMPTAKHMYQQVRNKHNILIVQAAGWWRRLRSNTGSSISIERVDLVDHIAEFALAIPCLPEFLQDDRQCSGPSAMEEASTRRFGASAGSRRRRAGCCCH
mmetsp:Transcript_3548/g.12971  ORF Transcript_3548/g.12971 Transcript_3548/m.12971 type:complete len:459 (+) Transcript_3548:40-1416(+)